MTKNKLEKEADKWLRKYLLCYDCEKKCNCIETNSYCEQQVLKAYVDSAEPREMQIAELKEEIHTWKEASSVNSYKAFQLQEENKSLLMHILELQKDKEELTNKCKELEAQIEEMKCCENCVFFKEKTYDICHRIKKLGTRKCAFYKMI